MQKEFETFLEPNQSMHSPFKLVRITTVPLSLKVLLRQQLKFMSRHFNLLAVSSGGVELKEVAEQEGVRTAAVEMTRAITPVQDLKSLWQLYQLLKKEKPTIVHTHTPKAGLIGMVAAKMAGIPLRFHTVAGLPLMESTGTKRKVLEKVEQLTYACATKVYPNSKNLAQFILDHQFCKSGKLKVLGNGSSNGIDTTFFAASAEVEEKAAELKKQYGIVDADFVFVFIGRLVKDKGIEELVEAFLNLKKEFKNIKLLLVGPYEPHLDPLSKEAETIINTEKDIICAGFQRDVRPFLFISQVLTFPSYREGFPNVPMQAGCFHLPSVVTNINGCNEIIEHQKNGLIIPVKNVSALQSAMALLLTNKKLYESMQSNARRMIVDRYDQQLFWQILLNEYKEQLKEHHLVS